MTKGRLQFYKFVTPLIAVVLMLPLLSDTAQATNGGIAPLTIALPAARSGQSYFWTLKAEGGVKPYRCTPLKLDIGTLALNNLCQITGMAPVVHSESITGPFIFKLHDRSKKPKTIEFPAMNFTVMPAKSTPTPTSTSTPTPTPTPTSSPTSTPVPTPTPTASGTNVDSSGTYTGTKSWQGVNAFAGTECDNAISGSGSTSFTLSETSGGKITSSDGSISGTRAGNTITVKIQNTWGTFGPYTWQLNGNTITGPIQVICVSNTSNALLAQGVANINVTRT